MFFLIYENFGQNLKIPTIVTRPQNGLCQHKAKDVKEDPIFSPFFTTRCMTRSPLETFDIGFQSYAFLKKTLIIENVI